MKRTMYLLAAFDATLVVLAMSSPRRPDNAVKRLYVAAAC